MASRAFGIDELENACTEHIEQLLKKSERILTILEDFQKFEDIRAKCFVAIAKHFDQLVRKKLEDFLLLTPDSLIVLLERDDLCLTTEHQILQVVECYLSQKREEENLGQDVIKAILKTVRFGYLSSEELLEAKSKLDIIPKKVLKNALAWRLCMFETGQVDHLLFSNSWKPRNYFRKPVFYRPGVCHWKVEEFSKLNGEIRSTSFIDRSGKKWYCSLEISEKDVGFFLNVDADLSIKSVVRARYTVEFLSSKDPGLSWRKTLDWHVDWTRGWGWCNVVTHDYLRNNDNGILINDTLHIIVNICSSG